MCSHVQRILLREGRNVVSNGAYLTFLVCAGYPPSTHFTFILSYPEKPDRWLYVLSPIWSPHPLSSVFRNTQFHAKMPLLLANFCLRSPQQYKFHSDGSHTYRLFYSFLYRSPCVFPFFLFCSILFWEGHLDMLPSVFLKFWAEAGPFLQPPGYFETCMCFAASPLFFSPHQSDLLHSNYGHQQIC